VLCVDTFTRRVGFFEICQGRRSQEQREYTEIFRTGATAAGKHVRHGCRCLFESRVFIENWLVSFLGGEHPTRSLEIKRDCWPLPAYCTYIGGPRICRDGLHRSRWVIVFQIIMNSGGMRVARGGSGATSTCRTPVGKNSLQCLWASLHPQANQIEHFPLIFPLWGRI